MSENETETELKPPPYMTVGTLRAHLENMDDATIIVLSRDPEGNGHAPLHQVSDCRWRDDAPWCGEIDDEDEPFPEEGSLPALCLWPG